MVGFEHNRGNGFLRFSLMALYGTILESEPACLCRDFSRTVPGAMYQLRRVR